MRRNKVLEYGLIIAYWLTVFNLLTFFVLYIIEAFFEFTNFNQVPDDELATYFLSTNQYLESTIFAFIFSILFIAVQELSERFRLDKKGFITVILIKSGIYVAGWVVGIIIVYNLMELVMDYPEGALNVLSLKSFRVLLVLMIIFIVSQIILLNFIIQTNKKIGPFNLRSFLTGKFQTPVEEDRVFLFLDLKSSTHHAEIMGNINYSKMIKDCFDDINFAIKETPGEIYQYVGDEVVITWTIEDAIKDQASLKCYFQIEKELNNRSEYYKTKYGIIPTFKGGLHGGVVTVVEIGIVKKDIAFHGDVLNTSSRIQNYCNTLGKSLLVSGYLKNSFPFQNHFRFEYEGRYLLKGKEQEIDIYSVIKN